MPFPIKIGLQEPTGRQAGKAATWWNVTDRVFKFVQWNGVVSLFLYAANKTESIFLFAVSAILLVCVYQSFVHSIASYLTLDVTSLEKLKKTEAVLKYLAFIALSVIILLIGYGFIAALVNAFAAIRRSG